MNLLGAVNYDPVGGAVSKVTTSLIAMTAFDTTNLRIAFTVPSHGMVHVRMTCVHHGSTTTAQVFLGCLEGSTLRGRAPVTPNLLGTAVATTRTKLEASFTLTGLTPGAVNWDAAYGVEIVSSANGAIKYGGPNNTTTDDAFGGFNFEIWDPQPQTTTAQLIIDSSGRAAADMRAISTDATAADNAESFFDGTGYAGTNNVMPTTTTVTNMVTANVTQISGDSTSADNLESYTDGTTPMPVNATQISGDATAADNAEAFFDGTGYAGTNNVIPTVTTTATATNVTTVNGLAANVITAASIATGAIDADAIAADAITAAKVAADVTTELQSGLATAAALATVQADTDNIQTRLPAALSGDGFMKADLLSIGDELVSGNNATLSLKKLDVRNTAGAAIHAEGLQYGIYSTGNVGIGAVGSDGDGISGVGSDGFSGASFYGQGTGHGIDAGSDGTGKSINAPQDIAVSDGDLTLTAIANKVLASVIETGYTLKQSMRLMLSALAGKLSGAATTTVTIRSATDAKNRIVATVDSDGNRTAVTHDTTD